MPETPLRSLPWHAGKGAGAPSGIGRWVAGLLAGRGKQTYAEPFAGMLGVLLQRPRAHEEVASDVDGRLLAWWRAVRDEPDALTARLAATPLFSKPHLDEAHVVAPDAEQSDVVRAAALAVICMTAWNGSTYRYVSPSTRGWPTVPDLARRLQLVSIWGCSAAETIERLTGRSLATRASSLAYCDPPYPGTSDKYGGFDAAAAADFEVAAARARRGGLGRRRLRRAGRVPDPRSALGDVVVSGPGVYGSEARARAEDRDPGHVVAASADPVRLASASAPVRSSTRLWFGSSSELASGRAPTPSGEGGCPAWPPCPLVRLPLRYDVGVGVTNTQRAIRGAYHANPNQCAHCSGPIILRDGVRLTEMRRQKFCSRSCAAQANNTLRQRTRKERACACCGALYRRPPRSLSILCSECNEQRGGVRLKRDASVGAIRAHARTVMGAANRMASCERCGYSRHVQVCHVRPVREFADDAPFREINDLGNLVALCPNCHWEFDHPG